MVTGVAGEEDGSERSDKMLVPSTSRFALSRTSSVCFLAMPPWRCTTSRTLLIFATTYSAYATLSIVGLIKILPQRYDDVNIWMVDVPCCWIPSFLKFFFFFFRIFLSIFLYFLYFLSIFCIFLSISLYSF